MAVGGGLDTEPSDTDNRVGLLTKRSHMELGLNTEHNSSTAHTMNTQCGDTAKLICSQPDNELDESVSKTADNMARHCPELTPCSTAELEHQASHPPVKFVNGFQKRLGVYKTGSRETDMTSDSESDISSLEIDSNLSHSSDLSNNDSLRCTFLPQNDEHVGERFSRANTPSHHRVENFDGVEHKTPLPDENQNDNCFRQSNFELKNTSREDLLLPFSVNKPRADLISQRGSVTTTSPRKTPNSSPKDKPLVIKIRRRTWTVSENSQHHESNQNGDVKKARTHSTGTQQAEIKSAFELSSSSSSNKKTLHEWQSIGHCLPVEKTDDAEKFFPPKQENNKKVLGASKTKHQRHKSKKLKGELTPHRKKKTSHQHHHKTKRKKNRESASRKHSKSITTHPGKTLRLPSDPQKAVKVLERALESINAQIKQLKKETGHGNKPRSHRGLHSKKPSKKRLHKETKRHNSTKMEKKLDLLPLTLSLFKLNDSFSIVPSLIVRDGDLHPAYSSSVDPGEPPVTTHPIWRWRIGQAPLPKPSAPDNQVMDWLNN